jgi:hypothetical protein
MSYGKSKRFWTNWKKNYRKIVTLSNKSSWIHVPFLLKLITVVTVVEGFLHSTDYYEVQFLCHILAYWKHIPNIPIKLFSFSKFKGVAA